MTAQGTHIALAELVFPTFLSQFDRKAFLIGTTFPDIRYLGVIERDKTHYYGLSLEDVLKEPNSFMAGLKFHCLVDEVREAYVVKRGIYSFVPTSQYITQSIKFLEDEIYHSLVPGWNEISAYYNDILQEELDFGINEDDISQWHKNLQDHYFSQPPNDEIRTQLILSLGFSYAVAEEINTVIATIRKEPKVLRIINDFYKEFPDLLRNKKRPFRRKVSFGGP